ncbi:hypothetical protein OIE13_20170 [Streptosporangium sp. NBC_01810]|uniref:hypothetical protein n=1 Tax=Streptosporangium sp. NBC_01810 TaxID=2975951 RepID=UPI002DD9CB63|nr:hypothetical protein [Streptosporangium sp. NBC_01810]WSA23288.1 hypothetical protein OIE13_20170 [Streptosporangium sp. NBC_01810]
MTTVRLGFTAEATQQFHPDLSTLVPDDPQQQPALLSLGQVRDPRGQLTLVVPYDGQLGARLGRDLKQVGVKTEEVGQGLLPRAQRSRSRRNRRLQLVLGLLVGVQWPPRPARPTPPHSVLP